ncbi:MAG: DNA polymerase III subunit beta [Rhabdochlamydiaceae bacterium]|nr:DNA polymerase III subunit beta [Rhabdochlamydiaceae bacterium]
MKVIIPRVDLVTLIGKIQNIVASKPTVPILANILLEAIDDQLILSATDLSISVRAHTEAKVLEEGGITLPARKLFQLIRELTVPQVEIHSTSPETASINAGSSHFKIQGIHRNEFPAFPDLAQGICFSMHTNALKEMLTRTSFAAARDDTRQVLNGVYLQNANQLATFMGTDGKRLAKIHTSVDLPQEQSGSYIIPLKTVEEMVRVLDSKEEIAKITLMADKISLEVGPVTLISKLVSGQYPDVNRVIPETKSNPLSLHREELISLLKQVTLFTSDNNSSVRFTFETGQLHISAMSGDIGEGRVNMPVNYTGENLNIAFNPVYFLGILNHSKDETVNFNISDSYSPCLVTDSSTAQFVIMPMRMES